MADDDRREANERLKSLALCLLDDVVVEASLNPVCPVRAKSRRLRLGDGFQLVENGATRQPAVEMSRHELENILSGGRNNVRVGGAGPCAANLYGLDSHDRGLVSAKIS
jgi:hypothetical protein